MAKPDKFGMITGKLGNAIMYRVGNQIRVRTKPANVKQPQTEAVVKAKSQFKRINSLASAIYRKTNLVGPELKPNEGKNPYSEFIKLMRWSGVPKPAIETLWNWETLKLTEGSLKHELIDLQLTSEGILKATWESTPSKTLQDYLFILCIDIETEQVIKKEVDYDIDQLEWLIPEAFRGKVVSCYSFRAQLNGNKILKSHSVFHGMMTL